MLFNSDKVWDDLPSYFYQLGARASKRHPESGEGLQVSRRTPGSQHKGIPATPERK